MFFSALMLWNGGFGFAADPEKNQREWVERSEVERARMDLADVQAALQGQNKIVDDLEARNAELESYLRNFREALREEDETTPGDARRQETLQSLEGELERNAAAIVKIRAERRSLFPRGFGIEPDSETSVVASESDPADEDATDKDAAGPRGRHGQLRLISLQCTYSKDGWGGSEPYLQMGRRRMW
ncbi:MAG: hypothetical protein N2C14_14060, partial [Planctomycetales bacterium]